MYSKVFFVYMNWKTTARKPITGVRRLLSQNLKIQSKSSIPWELAWQKFGDGGGHEHRNFAIEESILKYKTIRIM